MIDLRLGDCLEESKSIPDKSIDLILCDPPYGTTNIKWDTVIPFDEMWAMYKRLLNPRGCIVLFGSQPFTSALVMSNPSWFKYELIWNKNKCGSPGLAKYRPMKTHENILVFAPGKTVYNPQMEEGEPFQRKQSGNLRCNTHGYGFKPTPGKVGINYGTRYPKSILNISRDFSAQQQVHPTQKPVPLCRWLIQTFSNEQDMVMDNCMGSGSTGVAAKMLGRSFIGIEKSFTHYKTACSRINSILF